MLQSIRKGQRFYRYLPLIFSHIENWKDFIDCYRDKFTGIIKFKNGVQLIVDNPHCGNLINIIFFKKIYGTIHHQKTILEIGGNRGYFSTYAASSHKNAQVHVFEPDPRAFEILSKNIKINDFQNRIKPFNNGVGGEQKMIQLFLGDNSVDNSFFNISKTDDPIEVECFSMKHVMDNIIKTDIDLIKLNCEGAEYEILFSLDKSYLDRIKEVRMEYHNFNHDGKDYDVDEIKTYLTQFGFNITRFSDYTETHGILWMSK